MLGLAGDCDGECIAVDIAGPGQQINGEACIFQQGQAALGDNGGVVHRADGQLNGGEIGVNAAIGEFVGEAVDTMPIFFWLIAEDAIGIDAELAVRRAADQHGDKARLASVQVIGKHIHDQRGIFGRTGGICLGLRHADAEIADGELAVLCLQPLAETDQVKRKIDGSAYRDTCKINQIGAAAIGIFYGRHARSHKFHPVSLAVDEGIVMAQAGIAQQRKPCGGIDQSDFKGIIRATELITQGGIGDGEGKEAVVFTDDENLI